MIAIALSIAIFVYQIKNKKDIFDKIGPEYRVDFVTFLAQLLVIDIAYFLSLF
jgi:hypothetical protein